MQAPATRRPAILILGAGVVASAQTGKPGTTIHQEVDFRIPPERIYAALLDAKQFSGCTGLAAEIQTQAAEV